MRRRGSEVLEPYARHAQIEIDRTIYIPHDRTTYTPHDRTIYTPHIDAMNVSTYDAAMRTTIDLDPDVDTRLRALARERGVPLRTVINDALRAGTQPGAGDGSPYALPSRRLGVRPGIDLDKALRLAGELEDDEIVRKLDLRK